MRVGGRDQHAIGRDARALGCQSFDMIQQRARHHATIDDDDSRFSPDHVPAPRLAREWA